MATQFNFANAEVQFTDFSSGSPTYDALIKCREVAGNLVANIFFYADEAKLGPSQVVTTSGGDISISILFHMSQFERVIQVVSLPGRKTIICEADTGGPGTAIAGPASIQAETG